MHREICSKLTITTAEQCQWYQSGVFIDKSERISHLFQMFLLLILNRLSYCAKLLVCLKKLLLYKQYGRPNREENN